MDKDDKASVIGVIGKTKVSRFNIKTCFDVRTKSSFCWQYFGDLILKSDGKKKQVMTGQVFCNACLSEAQEDDGDTSFGLAKIKSYAKTVSTGNLNRHLRDAHNIKEEEKTTSEIIKEVFNTQQKSKTVNASSSKSKKSSLTLAKDMVLLYCKSLIPFDTVSDEGTKDFFQKYKIIGTKEDMPSRDTVCRIALDSIYESMLEDVKAQITSDVDGHAAVAIDLWTDHYRRLNYTTFTLHYLTPDFEHKAFTLCTKFIEGKKTGEKIKAVLKDAMESFGLQENKLYFVTNAGSEVKRAASLLRLDSHLCLGHALNNLIMIDGIRGVAELDAFVKKCKRIVQSIQYCLPELQTDSEEAKVEFINLLKLVSESLDNDEREPITYGDEDEESKSETQGRDEIPPTRWHTVLAMLECLAHLVNRNSLNEMLNQVGNEELKMYQREWNLLEDTMKLLTKFREVAEMITTQKLAALNLAMVFHLEIKDILNSLSDEESSIMLSLKQNMTSKIEARFPVTDKIVVAAMLDPRFISLRQIDTYLERRHTTKAAFLAKYIKEQPQTNTSTSPVFVACETSSKGSLLTRLSKKHSSGTPSIDYEFDEAEIECRKYLATATAEEFQGEDILLYWKEKKNSFPMLSGVARALLAIPVTSIPSKRIFSEAGLTLAVKRSRLGPASVNKVMFVHDNYKC